MYSYLLRSWQKLLQEHGVMQIIHGYAEFKMHQQVLSYLASVFYINFYCTKYCVSYEIFSFPFYVTIDTRCVEGDQDSSPWFLMVGVANVVWRVASSRFTWTLTCPIIDHVTECVHKHAWSHDPAILWHVPFVSAICQSTSGGGRLGGTAPQLWQLATLLCVLVEWSSKIWHSSVFCYNWMRRHFLL